MMIAGLPSSSPCSSIHRGPGIRTVPSACSAVRKPHSWSRSVTSIVVSSGGSMRSTNDSVASSRATSKYHISRL